MIRKLQTRFILLSMATFLLILSVIVAMINVVSYNNVINEADNFLKKISLTLSLSPPEEDAPYELTPETPFELRYFSAVLNNESGAVIYIDTRHIYSVDRIEVITYAKDVLKNENEKGFVDRFRYLNHSDNKISKIVFLDCGRQIASYQGFMFSTIIISLIGYLIVGLFIVFFSNRIIHPIADSYNKQKRFITDAGHDIKTPLAIIKADLDVLEMEFGSNEWVSDIQKQTERLTTLTNDLIYLSRMEEADRNMQMIEFPVSDIVDEAAASFRMLAQSQNKELVCHIQPLISFTGNEKALHQLTTVLLDNAVKYSPEGSVITLSLEKQGKTLQLTVENNSRCELSKEQLSHLFERFYRTDSSRNSKTGGYGIGLSIAKAVVSAHNGKIKAECPDECRLRIIATFPM